MGQKGTEAAPAAAGERVVLLDALRGFALFGILLANIGYWSGWSFLDEARRIALAGKAQVDIEHLLHMTLIDGKFYTIFSLLFGLGFALQLSRLEARGADGIRIFRRRLLVLLAIGLVHLCLIWDGDILTLYALLGLLLPFVRHWSERRTLIVAVLLLLSPLIGVPLFKAIGFAPHDWFYGRGIDAATRGGLAMGGEVDWLLRTDWQSRLIWCETGVHFRIGYLLESWRLPKVLGIMMIGAMLGRRLVEGRLIEDRELMRRVLIWGLAIGLPFSLAYAIAHTGQDNPLPVLGTAPLGFAYAVGFVLLWPRAPWLRIFAAPGRMALTNYLMHSLLGSLIFFGFGFGLVGKFEPWAIYLIAVAIFAFQILFSTLWLKRFDQGPMEWLWRLGTYGRRRA
ncbi:DUF418 domain-containing protein [Sphingomonas sp. AOB5]|uniref:DUF418 domain-containing protein n=1 Tax=Sphingomonas sp. AOB5 TaxID=3034017 RepID=UPI0023F947FA|nr:DUF418 domain-containing protein [Sphingomonas sp. AOB5]MDF7774125.1 DUF418 domain-containing protein [Sphingomonas sp. AOB5]